MDFRSSHLRSVPMVLLALTMGFLQPTLSVAQEQVAAAGAGDNAATSPEPLSADEMEVLVARIALYPDDLVAAIVAASLYPLQIVQAERYLTQVQTRPDLKPNSDWDGGVISLLNYPEIVKMMNDDLDWTESLGEVVANQEKDMLEAVQRLRDRAVAQGVLKTDEKTKVVQQNNKVVIEPSPRMKFMCRSTSPRCSTSPTMFRCRSPIIRAPIPPTTIRPLPTSPAS